MNTNVFSTMLAQLRTELRDPANGGTETSLARWTSVEKKGAINAAILDTQRYIKFPYVDESITLAENSFVYNLPVNLKFPSDIRDIFVEPEDSTDTPYTHVTAQWQAVDSSGSLKLHVNEVWNSGSKLRILYDGIPQTLSNDGDVTPVNRQFILARAKSYLHSLAAETTSQNDIDLHLKRADHWWARSRELFEQMLLEQRRELGEGRVNPSGW